MPIDIIKKNVFSQWIIQLGFIEYFFKVQATVVGFLAAVAAIILGWIPEGKYYLDHSILLCSSSVATAFIASLLQGK